jgi:hypothetical protein
LHDELLLTEARAFQLILDSFSAAQNCAETVNRRSRDEHEALCEGIGDLVRLLRYERRAWSRRKRAVRAFMAIKLTDHDRMEPI